jgi:hypothetical protein
MSQQVPVFPFDAQRCIGSITEVGPSYGRPIFQRPHHLRGRCFTGNVWEEAKLASL